MELETQKCTKCGETKPVGEFYRQYKMASGYLSKCKTCTKRDVRENRAKKIEYYRAFDRERANLPHRVEARQAYANTPQGKKALQRGSVEWTKRNPVKKAATTAVSNAIRDGHILREPCEVCGNVKAQAHHDDYGKPLDVRWLCTKHHAEWHKHNDPLCPPQGES